MSTTTSYQRQPRAYYRRTFDGSDHLFTAAWRRYLGYLNGAIDAPGSDQDVRDWLDQIAGELVNDGGSRFYIHG
jgi:hypothetical protein